MNEMSTWSPSLRFLTYYGSQQERAQLRSMAKYSDVRSLLAYLIKSGGLARPDHYDVPDDRLEGGGPAVLQAVRFRVHHL